MEDTSESRKDISISVFFPCYNEEENISRLTDQTIQLLNELNADYEIILVNDGSTDKTAEIADQYAEKNDRVKAVHHTTNRGYGAALQSGFKSATKEHVFYTDGDCQFDIKELPELLPLIKDYDIVSCYRLNRQDNLIRKINGFCWSTLVSILFNLKLKDIDCAFKLYKTEIFKNINLKSIGALIDTEILARAHKKGYKITQKGVHHYPRTRGKQTGANFRVIFRAFSELFKLYRQIKNEKAK